jgi:DNA topoisomerase-1
MVDLPLSVSNLVYVSDAEPGIRRERRGKGFCFRLPCGSLVKDTGTLARIRALGIPPAYRDVWICLTDQGHLQATGFDARGRKQYRYHQEWQDLRSGHKFDQLAAFGASLPRLRRRIARDLAAGVDQETGVLAAIAMLLDLAHIRVGNLAYARENNTFGATTLLKRHVRILEDRIELKFRAKGGKRVQRTLKHPRLQKSLEAIADLPGRRLFAWRDAEGMDHSIESGKLNAYLCDAAGMPISAKTFRTWGGSVAAFTAAMAAIERNETPSVKTLCSAAADELHNTPAISRKSYIHPKVLDLALPGGDAEREAVAALLAAPPETPRGLTRKEALLIAYLPDNAVAATSRAA